MSSTYGENLRLTIFGQSHSAAIGVTVEGLPAGFPIDMEALQAFLHECFRVLRLHRAATRIPPPAVSPTCRSSSPA